MEKNNFPLVCINCLNYPTLRINPQLNTINIECPNCSFSNNLTIPQYIHELRKKEPSFKWNNHCKDHDCPYDCYCTFCYCHICSKDDSHNKHNVIKLGENKEKVNQRAGIIKEGYKYILEELSVIKNSYIKELVDKINQIEASYEKCQLKYFGILNLLEMLFKSYNEDAPNYYVEQNILENTNFTINHFEPKTDNLIEKIDKLKLYFDLEVFQKKLLNINSIVKKKRFPEISEITSLTLLNSGDVVLSFSNRIKIYPKKAQKQEFICLEEKGSHNDRVNYVCVLDDERLVSCTKNGKILIWNYNIKTKPEHIYEKAHLSEINKVILLPEKRIASCSNDGTIKIWNTNTKYELLHTLDADKKPVKSILLLNNNHYLVSGSDDTIIFWNMNTKEKERCLNGINCYYQNSLLQVSNSYLFVGGKGVLSIIDLRNYSFRKKTSDKVEVIYSMVQLTNDTVLCGCQGGILIEYDICFDSFGDFAKLRGKHGSSISSLLKINENSFITGSFDKIVEIYSLKDK